MRRWQSRTAETRKPGFDADDMSSYFRAAADDYTAEDYERYEGRLADTYAAIAEADTINGMLERGLIDSETAASMASNNPMLGVVAAQASPQKTPQNPFPPPPPNCEAQLATLFGDPNGKPGARMSITTDISTGGYRGYDPNIPASADPDAQHLYFFPHLTSPDGTEQTPVYVPGDFKYIDTMTIIKANGPMRMFYSQQRDATVFILHLDDFQTTRKGGRIFVGYTGGKGGDTHGNLHAHFAVHRGRGFNPSNRVPFSTVFCK